MNYRVLGLVLILNSCNFVKDDIHTANKEQSIDPDIQLSTVQSVVFEAKCNTCHNGSNIPGNFTSIDGILPYVVPGNPESSEIYQRITSSDATFKMPPGEPLRKNEIEMIRQSILNLQKTPPKKPDKNPSDCKAPEPSVDTSLPLEPNYPSLKTHLFQPYCIYCHNPEANRPARPYLTCKDTIVDLKFDILDEVELKSMPPRRIQFRPSQEVVDMLIQWIDSLD